MHKINSERLWTSLMDMAQIGATPRGGVRRLALTAEDLDGRNLFVKWCQQAGLAVRVDAIGNIFGHRSGTDPTAKPVVCGSHLDTQPEGGRFDGAFGVLAALEIVRTLNDLELTTTAPIEIVSWTNEEGARFTPSLLGSAVFTGATDLDTALGLMDAEGVTVRQALASCGYAGQEACRSDGIDSYFEAHIEQGPILEKHGSAIGVVTGSQAIRWLDVAIDGFASHAGTTPMAARKDAFLASAAMACALESLVKRFAPLGLATIGQIDIPNASRNTIAGHVAMSVDLRHPDGMAMEAMDHAVRTEFSRIATTRGVTVEISTYLDIPATPFNKDCIALVERAASRLGYIHEKIISGAGHDAVNLARHVPSAMVFIPCVDGLSHNEAENALPADVTAGTNVLLHAVLDRASGRTA